MASDDYATTGGTLKLKGVKASKVTKKKKEKSRTAFKDADRESISKGNSELAMRSTDDGEDGQPSSSKDESTTNQNALGGKTEAERRHEEMRRQRFLDRLKKEGVKTHKERVEELNKYLSSLSEHHDMPRIGPG